MIFGARAYSSQYSCVCVRPPIRSLHFGFRSIFRERFNLGLLNNLVGMFIKTSRWVPIVTLFKRSTWHWMVNLFSNNKNDVTVKNIHRTFMADWMNSLHIYNIVHVRWTSIISFTDNFLACITFVEQLSRKSVTYTGVNLCKISSQIEKRSHSYTYTNNPISTCIPVLLALTL